MDYTENLLVQKDDYSLYQPVIKLQISDNLLAKLGQTAHYLV